MDTNTKVLRASILAIGICAFAGADAATIDWNTWTSSTSGTIAADSITVTYTPGGPVDNLVSGYPSYTPASTFADGSTIANAPTSANNILQIVGGNTNVNMITFSTPIVDPVMTIWSLGQGGINASFNFIDATPLFVSGGPNGEYGGSAISVSGNDVFGREGNGSVMFSGTFSSISWTNPVFENWYGFNVGISGVGDGGPVTTPVPEPETYALLMAGLGLLGVVVRRRRAAQG